MNPPQVLTREEDYGAADMHIHSTASDGMADVTDILEFVAQTGDLNVIAITDHDEIQGSYQAREIAAKRNYPFEVVVGVEINTVGGHLLALFVEDLIPGGLSVADTVSAIHAQGGLCILPHPMSMLSESLNHSDIAKIIRSNEPDLYFDGIETENATIVGSISNRRAKKINRMYNLAAIGGSDAHFLISIGSARTLFPGRTASELRKSILEGTTKALRTNHVSYFDIGLLQIIKQQRKSGGFFVRGMLKNFSRRLSK
jgi:predicted metal-dependent phosphoesterase TrpH